MRALLEKTPHGNRHRLLNTNNLLLPATPITTLRSLKHHLQIAIQLEHSTIPPYLCALYTLREGSNTFASQTIRSVVMEEMLHMIQAANILNAIGGKPSINGKEFLLHYPTYLPDSDDAFLVHLERFSKSAMDTFLKIEQPAAPTAAPEGDHYQTIGQFYKAIELGLEYVNTHTKGGIFTGKPERQVRSEQYYGGGGKLIEVHNLNDARLAIFEIVGQGEGIPHHIEDPDHMLFGEEIEYAHYFRFMEIRVGKKYKPQDVPNKPPTGPKVDVDWSSVYPMKRDPKMSDYKKGSAVWQMARDFNLTYTALLNTLHQVCNGKQELLMQKGIPLMYDMKYKALALLQVPIGKGTVAGPTFEYMEA